MSREVIIHTFNNSLASAENYILIHKGYKVKWLHSDTVFQDKNLIEHCFGQNGGKNMFFGQKVKKLAVRLSDHNAM